MNNFSVKIHEFSTGINAEQIADGRWISRGFTVGRWMNSTLAEIPPAVKRSIANKEFAVAEGAYSESPAVIGRVVLGSNGEDNWSVVAVVIEFGDDRDRSFSAYRYFLCKEPNSLGIILAWMESYRQERGHLPVFNPNETKITGHPNLYNSTDKPNSSLSDEFQDWVRNHPEPTIIISSNEEYDVQVINEMAVIKADIVNEPVSWAYNVEALERAEKFIIIKAASNEAFDRITRARDVQINKPRVLEPAVDENEIETAVKGLMSSAQVRAKNVETIIANLEQNKVSKDYWEEIFDGLGAAKAIESGSSHENTVRLLTLRAIVIPETLPEFLRWLKIESKKNQENPHQKTSLEFQEQIDQIRDLNKVESFLTGGIKIAVTEVYEKHLPVEDVVWLLTVKGSLWAKYRNRLIEDVRADLKQIIITSRGQRLNG